MHNKENIDNMARRYKDEMMRIYRMNCAGGHVHHAVPCDNANPPKPEPRCSEPAKNSCAAPCPPPCTPECKFVPAQDLICNEANRPQTLPAYGTNNMPVQTDITPSMVNGTGAAGQSLVTGGVPNFDTYTAESEGMNSSGEKINVYPESMSGMNRPAEPAASAQYVQQVQPSDMMSGMSADSFGGVMINPVTAAASDPAAVQSDIFEEKLPDFELPPDIEVGRDIPDSISPRFIISANWINLTGDNGWGYLQFEVTTGSLGNPVQNATVVVSRVVNNRILLTRIVTTGYNGLTRTLVLPAPRYVYNPFRPSSVRPFAEYRASVYANGYYPVTNINLMIYAGVKSVQPVDLIPLPQYSPNPGIQPRSGS